MSPIINFAIFFVESGSSVEGKGPRAEADSKNIRFSAETRTLRYTSDHRFFFHSTIRKFKFNYEAAEGLWRLNDCFTELKNFYR